MDWIHCNSCFKQPRQSAPGRKFFLTSCGHVYCGTCVSSKPVQEKCIVCASSFTTIHLNEEMKPEVQEYFKDVQSALKKISEVMVFQNGHRQRLATHSKLVDDKYAAAKEEVKRVYEVIKTKDKRIQELENALKFYKKKLEDQQSASARPPSRGPPVVPNHTPSPILSGSMKTLTQKILQTSQGMQKTRDYVWVTPNRLTLQYKPMPITPVSSRPSPDSSMTPTQASHTYNGYRDKRSEYSSQPTTPGSSFASPTVPVHSPNTPNQGNYYRLSGGLNLQQRRPSQYYDSSVPGASQINLSSLNLSASCARYDPQKK